MKGGNMSQSASYLLAGNLVNFKDLQYQIVFNQNEKNNTIKSFNLCYKGKKIKKIELHQKNKITEKTEIEELVVNVMLELLGAEVIKTEVKKNKKQKVDKEAKKEAANELLNLFNLK